MDTLVLVIIAGRRFDAVARHVPSASIWTVSAISMEYIYIHVKNLPTSVLATLGYGASAFIGTFTAEP
ncbi:MAG: hypothetical protein QN178_18010, partial [Armatimonadota bacterium]|nr:hypothetical protein [Armatimonadota bacterium]